MPTGSTISAVLIQERREESLLLRGWQGRVDPGDERGPQGSRRACAAVWLGLVYEHKVIQRRTGKRRNVGQNAAVNASGIDRGNVNLLPGRTFEDRAHPAPGRSSTLVLCTETGRLPPDDLLDVRAGFLEHGSPHGQDVRAAARKVDMPLAVGHLVARAVVSGGDAGRDAEQPDGVQSLVDGLDGSRRPARVVLGRTPTDRQHGRICRDDGIEQVNPPALIERRKVNRDRGSRTQAGDDLDIHHHLDAGDELVVTLVGRKCGNLFQRERRRIDRDRLHVRHRAAELVAVGGDVVGEITATELGDRDGLAGRVTRRKIVARFQISRRQR